MAVKDGDVSAARYASEHRALLRSRTRRAAARLESRGYGHTKDAGRIEFQPTLSNFQGRPSVGHFGIDAKQDVEMIIHQAETCDGDGEDGVQLLESLSLFSVLFSPLKADVVLSLRPRRKTLMNFLFHAIG